MAAALSASCGGDAEAPPDGAVASAETCAENDIECRNREWMKAFTEENRRQAKLPLEEIFGDWEVIAALEPEGRSMEGTWVTTYVYRDVWIGAGVSITRAAITIDAPAGAPVLREDGLGDGALYPRCTEPDFDTDEMVSASPVEEWIDLWRNFGFEKPAVGRPAIVHCTGDLELPDDQEGHVAEMTVEESDGIESLYYYDRDHLIVQWGRLQFLLRRKPEPAEAPL
jgi:hypothetical protein